VTWPHQKLPSSTRHPISVRGPDLPLLSQTTPAYLPQLLGGQQVERGVHAARLLPGARCLLGLQGQFALPNAALESKSTCSKVTSREQTPGKARPIEALRHLCLQPCDALSAGFRSLCRPNRLCPERRWPNRGRGTSGAERTTLDAQPHQKRGPGFWRP